ncbi:DUF1203 domain-containing protein [Solilutibacter silvestris]|uniref:DUF1203 domain-containing protein n=1 Tax=Solilutibacter silvestris TaxID=1645665 RepID=UPI003D35594E
MSTMGYRIRGLDPAPFQSLYGLDDDALAARHVVRCRVDGPGFPERVELRDMQPGETALLVNHEHLAVDTPYRSRHAIYVREGATQAAEFRNEIPDVLLRRRMLSLRAFKGDGMMLDADVCSGDAIEALIERMLAREDVAFLHAHSASHGCYLAVVERDD